MTQSIIKLFSGVALIALGAGQASATVIEDNYWGADGHGYGDRIGNDSYEVHNMEVSFSGDFLNVRVNTNFNADGDPYGVDFGDLFISSDGWNPHGSAPYQDDDASNGEDWEFVFDTSENRLYGGNFDIALSDDRMDSSRYIFRNGQEVQRAGGGTALEGGSVDLSQAGEGGYIEYSVLTSSLGLNGDSIGFKWGMTCANDTIEGSVSVPEPHGLLLLGAGLLGLGIARRKKRV